VDRDHSMKLVGEVALAAAAIGCQIAHQRVGYDAGFMWVDLVGVPPMLAAYLWGPRAGMRVLLAPVLWILLVEPVGWIGAGFKASATLAAMVAASRPSARLLAGGALVAAVLLAGGTGLLVAAAGPVTEAIGAAALAAPLVAAVVVWAQSNRGRTSLSVAWRPLLLAVGCAIVLRGSLMVIADLLFAFPVFFGVPAGSALSTQPPWSIFVWNGVQAAVDVAAAGVVAGWCHRPERHSERGP